MGDQLKVQLFFMGKPLADKTLTARNRTGSAPSIVSTSKTDGNGVGSFNLSRKDDWFIHATHMIPCADLAGCDWESFWAPYNFGME